MMDNDLNIPCDSNFGGHRVARVMEGTRYEWVDGPKDKRGRRESTQERVPAVELVILKPGPDGECDVTGAVPLSVSLSEHGVISALPLSISLKPEDARRMAMDLVRMASTIDGDPAVVPISSELTSVRVSTLD